MRSRLLLPTVLLALCLVAGAVLLTVQVEGSTPSSVQRATQAGLLDARTTMVWESGPVVQSSRVIRLGQLGQYVRILGTPVRNDVSVSSLIRQYRADRPVDFVVLFGKYNTLPPDEGVDVHGQALALVDMKTDTTLYLMN